MPHYLLPVDGLYVGEGCVGQAPHAGGKGGGGGTIPLADDLADFFWVI